MFLLLFLFLISIPGLTPLPDLQCDANPDFPPVRWQIPIFLATLPSAPATTIPDGRTICIKNITQAHLYPPRQLGGKWGEPPYETDNWAYVVADAPQRYSECSTFSRFSMCWMNSRMVKNDKNETGVLSTYSKFYPQKIQYGEGVPEGDYVILKMYLTPSDCALPIEEIAAKNLTQWYPEGGYFRVVQVSPGIIQYEGSGTFGWAELGHDKTVVSF